VQFSERQLSKAMSVLTRQQKVTPLPESSACYVQTNFYSQAPLDWPRCPQWPVELCANYPCFLRLVLAVSDRVMKWQWLSSWLQQGWTNFSAWIKFGSDFRLPQRCWCEICPLLRYYATSNGNTLPTFRDNVSVPSSRVKKSNNVSWTTWSLKMGPICCLETSVKDYHSMLCNIPEEGRSQGFDR
jgi:hypothetical protein